MLKIAIIGDSSTSGIGVGTACYPYLLQQRLQGKVESEIHNYGVPGLTSSDAKSFYLSESKALKSDYLVVYLGNNEASLSVYKGYEPHWRWEVKRRLAKKTMPSLKPPEIRQKYRFHHQPLAPTIANKPEDYRQNLLALVKAAKKQGAQVILINPIANTEFVAGAGSLNSVFFKFINGTEHCADFLDASEPKSRLLIEGIRHQEAGEWELMEDCYRQIVEGDHADLLQLIAQNNGAVAQAADAWEDAEAKLLGLVDRNRLYNPQIYFNLYRLYQQKGDTSQAQRYRALAYETDPSLYRVKANYRKVMFEVSYESNVHHVDLEELLTDEHFIDYCHPTLEGHEHIADKLTDLILKHYSTNASANSRYRTTFISPNHSLQPDADIIDYYSMDYDLSSTEIRTQLEGLLRQHSLDALPPLNEWLAQHRQPPLVGHLMNFLHVNATHPLFNQSILEQYPPFSHEVLNMPEYYLYRLLFNYYQAYEQHLQVADGKQSAGELTWGNGLKPGTLLKAADYQRLILRHNRESLSISLNLSAEYLDQIEAKLQQGLAESLVFEDLLFWRQKSVIYWYTRESFRYGTQSRASMLYDCLSLDAFLETTVVGMVIAYRLKSEKFLKFQSWAQQFEQLKELHEAQATQYRKAPTHFDHEAYQQALYQAKANCLGR